MHFDAGASLVDDSSEMSMILMLLLLLLMFLASSETASGRSETEVLAVKTELSGSSWGDSGSSSNQVPCTLPSRFGEHGEWVAKVGKGALFEESEEQQGDTDVASVMTDSWPARIETGSLTNFWEGDELGDPLFESESDSPFL